MRRNNASKRNIYSAIDLGTNNCRLLVAEQTADGFKVIDSFSRVVRLGEGLSQDGMLSDAAINRTIEALDICVTKIRRRGATHIRNVATQACREAKNCNEFIERVEKEVRIKLHIIDPAEEARLAVLGCKALLDPKFSRAIVFDIGGGSTELIWVKVHPGGMPEILDWTSIPYGVVNISEQYGTRETIPTDRYQSLCQKIMAAIEPFEEKNEMRQMIAQNAVQLLGTSGTITTLTALHFELDVYDRSRVDGALVTAETIQDLCRLLSGLSYDQRLDLRGIGPDRADLVVAGCAILETILSLWPIPEIRVADRGIREGMLLDMMATARRQRRRRRRYGGSRKKSAGQKKNAPERSSAS